VLPPVHSELANELLKNPYNISFLNLSEEANERDLENAILANIKKFCLNSVLVSHLRSAGSLKVGSKDFTLIYFFIIRDCIVMLLIELKST
jgi:predicted nuclease of restriction endonuclease-like (RecB) superfamily